jgi:FAD/FMN-containing dehydrogenase
MDPHHEARRVSVFTDREIAALNARMVGDAVHPEHQQARGIRNHVVDSRPGVVVRPKGEVHVAAAIAFASEHGACSARVRHRTR